jgi:acid phosphatase type 7
MIRGSRRLLIVLVPLLAVAAGVASAAAPRFADDFESGDLSGWLSSRGAVVAERAIVHQGTWATSLTSAGSPTYLRGSLGTRTSDLYARAFFSVQARSTATTLLELETRDRNPVIRFGLAANGDLVRTAVVSGARNTSHTDIEDSAWHELQVHATIGSGAGHVDVWLDGSPVADVSGDVSLGSTPVQKIQLGDRGDGRIFQIAFDDVATSSGYITAPRARWTIAAAGDIACDPANAAFNSGTGSGGLCREQATSDLVAADNPDAVLALGDNQYECGGYDAFVQSYGPSWGRFRSMTFPVLGNHEYQTSGGTDCASGATGYFRYFGSRAGQSGKGWYSTDLGAWHLIALNSECSYIGGCGAGSAEETWLKSDLRANAAECTLAFYHRPRFGATSSDDTDSMGAMWSDLEAAKVDVVLNGHIHEYARFQRLGASGSPEAAGIREFIVGTGGRSYQGSGSPRSTVQASSTSQFGVLKLTLRDGAYDWEFVPTTTGGFTDSGTDSCV